MAPKKPEEAALKCNFELSCENFTFTTKTDGDRLAISHIDFDINQAKDMTELVNSGDILDVTIKKKGN